jgi:1-acyl-sn-glycerol-3-phosphate acyltransferase
MILKRLKALIGTFYETFQASKIANHFFQSHPQAAWNDPFVQNLSKNWARKLLQYFQVDVQTLGEPTSQPAIYVGNHLSYLDIVALYSIKHLCFVAKSEVGKWPIIGNATRAAGTLFVERNSARSRVATAEALTKAVRDGSKSVCIFPEGTTSIEGKEWRRGVFRVAMENNLWLQPMGFVYSPIRRAAYIDDDTLVPHMWNMIQKDRTQLIIKFFEARKIQDLERDMKNIEAEVKTWVREQLSQQGYFKSSVGYIE